MGMRSIHNGGLTFGLVNVAVKMYVATESHDTKFHLYHGGDCNGSIGMPKVCKQCGEQVAYADIVKGVERDGETVYVTADDFATLDNEVGPQIDVLGFVNRDEIDPILFESTYYLDADKGSEKGYALLREVLTESERVGIVTYSLRQKTHRGVLRVYDDVLAIHVLMWPDEVRPTDALTGAHKKIELSPQELKMAHALVDSMMAPWEPSEHIDTYAQRLAELIDVRASGGQFVATTRDDDGGGADVSDLLAKLEASVSAKTKRPSRKAVKA